jgi:hypothetical protein
MPVKVLLGNPASLSRQAGSRRGLFGLLHAPAQERGTCVAMYRYHKNLSGSKQNCDAGTCERGGNAVVACRRQVTAVGS